MENVIVIIPTYNAGKSIVASIKGVKSVVPKASVLVVDDNSPDGTAEEVNSSFKKDKSIAVLIRKEKGGRGSAVMAGFKEGLKHPTIKYFMEMDADLCHNPKYIPQLVEKCRTADVIIASKYLSGSTIQGLHYKRVILSKLMNFAARIILRVPITDYSNGYRCYSRKAVEYISKRKFIAKGFVALSEIVYICYKNGFKIREIPFDFKQVDNGVQSNLNLKEIREAIITLLKLRFTK